MKEKVRIGIIQIKVEADLFSPDIRKKNMEHVLESLDTIAGENPDIVVLPEEFYAGTGYGPISLPETFTNLKTTVFAPLQEKAKKYNYCIAGSLVGKIKENEFKGNNIGFIIDNNGELLDHQERIHLNITEEPYSFPGTTLRVYDLEFGKVGLLVGLDILFPEIARKLAMEGVEILVSPILSPGAGPDEKTKTRFPDNLYKQCAIARALENQVYIAMVNGIGQFVHVDLPLFGGSLVAGPEGKIYEADTSEVIKVVEIDIDDKEEALKEFPLLDVRNAELCKITE